MLTIINEKNSHLTRKASKTIYAIKKILACIFKIIICIYAKNTGKSL